MPNHSGFAVTAQFELIILLTADLSRGLESELKPILVKIVPFICKVTNSSPNLVNSNILFQNSMQCSSENSTFL